MRARAYKDEVKTLIMGELRLESDRSAVATPFEPFLPQAIDDLSDREADCRMRLDRSRCELAESANAEVRASIFEGVRRAVVNGAP